MNVCSQCAGEGWYADHADECYAADECISAACPVQRPCEQCRGEQR